MAYSYIIEKSLSGTPINLAEALSIYLNASLPELMAIGHQLRMVHHPSMAVTWQIDRNVNYANGCTSGCTFCNFYRPHTHKEAYILDLEEYDQKIEELFCLGGDQLLLQGGLHPKLGLEWYKQLFRALKQKYPTLKLHALGPPEIHHIATMEGLTYREVLVALREAGLDSLPGAGAEILSDRVRKLISPAKCNTKQWLEVMRQAHQLHMPTSATMMFGHIETPQERLKHLIMLRNLQQEKPADSPGFLAFIPWPFQGTNTLLAKKYPKLQPTTSESYLRLIAISRIILHNIHNIQASWLTVGSDTAQISLWAGANDLGSIMIEENVVSSAGSHHKMDTQGIQNTILEAGFTPRQRNQSYQILPEANKNPEPNAH